MKKTIAIVLLISVYSANSQNFQGKAVYKTHQKVSVKIKGNDAMQKRISERLKKEFQKTYTLYFNPKESFYKVDEKLEKPVKRNRMSVMFGRGSEKTYKNISEQKITKQTELMGKLFLIKDQLQKPKWVLTEETKNIGTYKCHKATYSYEKKRNTMDKETGKIKSVIDTVQVTAWYTPQIPISNGPEKYWGLPGLILEVNQGKKTIVCTEVVLNPSEKIEITPPKKGKKVTQKEFDKIKEEKTAEMMQRFQNNRKGRKKSGITIQVN